MGGIPWLNYPKLLFSVLYRGVHCPLVSGKELVDRKDYYGKTPLYWAAYKGQRRSVELLLEHGANVNMCCKHGGTPLHAAIGLFPDCTLLLIQVMPF